MSIPSIQKPFINRIKPLGWAFIVFFSLVIIGGIGLLIQSLSYPISRLPTGAEAMSRAPTITPYATSAKTGIPSAAALPAGWQQARGLNGKIYLKPGPEDEQLILVAFKDALSYGLVEDGPDKALLTPADKQVINDNARQHSTPSHALQISDEGNAREIVTFGPINPIQCSDDHTCRVARAKLGVKGAVLYDEAACRSVGKTKAPCILRKSIKGAEPYVLQIAVLNRQEDGTWKVAEYWVEKLPGPPPSR